MTRPRPTRASRWQRLLDAALRASPKPAQRPRPAIPVQAAHVNTSHPLDRPRPDLLQSLGGRID